MPTKTYSPQYYSLIVIFFFFQVVGLQAQQEKDSLTYYRQLSQNAADFNDLLKSYQFFKTHNERSEYLKKKNQTIYSYFYLADIEYKLGQLYESEATAVRALQYIDGVKQNDWVLTMKIALYNQLGIIQKDRKNYARANEYYDKILEISKDSLYRNIVLNNKANALLNMKNYRAALKEFKVVYQNSLSINDLSHKAIVLDNFGFTKSKLNLEGGLNDLQSALEIRLQEENIEKIYESYIHLAEYYFDRSDTSKVQYYAIKALAIAEKLNNPYDRLKSMSFLNKVKDYSRLNDYVQLRDSIDFSKQMNENKFAAIKYNFDEERRELNKSKLVQEKQRKEMQLFGVISISGFIISVLLYILLKARHRKEKLEKEYETESRISKKVHDEVANDVYQIMTRIQNTKVSNSEMLDDLEFVYEKTRDISRENSLIALDDRFNNVLAKLIGNYKSTTTNIITKGLNELDWTVLNDSKKKILYRVIQELLINMKKHSNATIVLIDFSFLKNKLHINYKDNGQGAALSKSGGLLNAESRIEALKGSITFETSVNNGFKANIII